jgi:hypothetical protein
MLASLFSGLAQVSVQCSLASKARALTEHQKTSAQVALHLSRVGVAPGSHRWAGTTAASTARERCLTLRSTGHATAGHLGPVGGTRYIFANRAKASCRSAPVSSNVRHRNSPN